MGLVIKKNIAHNTVLGIWKKEETLDLLESVFPLNKHENAEFQRIKNEARKKEWLITRILLTELLENRITIFYTTNGKPYLRTHNSNISLSHSHNFVAIIVSSEYYPGVDIEQISERVEKVKNKFLSPQELEWCLNIDQLTACWCAKESIFKIYEKELDFHDMIVAPFVMDSPMGRFKVSVIKKEKEGDYSVNFQKIESDILTYTLSKSPID